MNIKEFLFGSHRRINSIIRFNTRIRTSSESVSAHSFFVAFYSYIIGCCIKPYHKINMEKLLRYALFHDLEECVSGDILTPFKKKFEKEYNKLSMLSMRQVTAGLPPQISKDIIHDWKMSKTGIEGKIVDFCDDLSGYIYCIEQIKTGNTYFKDIASDYRDRLEHVKLKELRYIASQFIYEHGLTGDL